MKSFASLATFALVTTVSPLHATGIYAPNRWLEFGGVAAVNPPEFMWDVEVRRIAREFTAPEKLVLPDQAWFTEPKEGEKPTLGPDDPKPQAEERQADFLARLMDHRDFVDALKQGKIKAVDQAKAIEQNDHARQVAASFNETTTDALPEEAASEFADYHRAAAAYRHGVAHWDEAVKALEALLARPKEERQYRSIWAAYMLGKIALNREEDTAPKWFQMTRALAKEGFKDSVGLAADSYGWEAKHELQQKNLEKAARLYLTQLALGDPSAVVSLKAVIPDRPAIDGMMNFGELQPPPDDPAAREKWDKEQEAKIAPELLRNARDPVLCQIESAHVLATETTGVGGEWMGEGTTDRSTIWLKVIESAGLKDLDDAWRLGWVAYAAGDYNQAKRWMKLNKKETDGSLWLEARLARRDGDLKLAAKLMAQALDLMRDSDDLYSSNDDGTFITGGYGFPFNAAASGELGSLQLSRTEFVNSMQVFFEGGLWPDACFVAEHVVTADEFKTWVDANPAPEDAEHSLAKVLARRLVREDRYKEARAYFPEEQQKELDEYTAALAKGANEKLSKKERARAWFDAAMIARYSGMELMGTEFEPDGAYSEGSFESSDVAGERESGIYQRSNWVTKKQPDGSFQGEEVVTRKAPAVTVSAEEKKRLAKFKPSPNKRFHYRYVAAALGWKAALLLPDNSAELADVLNSSGSWIKNDDKAADKYFQAIERRASKTEIGKEAGAKHWFVDHDGPWSVAPKE